MTSGLDYHRRVGPRAILSLQYANPDPHEVIEKEQNRSEAAGTNLRDFKSSIVPYRLSERIYVLYIAEIHPREFPDDDLQNLSDADRILIQTLLDGFETIEKDCAESGSPLLWYKRPDLSEIVQQIDRVQWRQSVSAVGGNLLSNLITGHGLPNANHRTSISFLETYLQTFDPTFEIPDTGVDDEWYDWSADFVQNSKRFLMLSRKSPLFRYLLRWGCEYVSRKNGDEVYLDDYDIHISDPYTHFSHRHRELCTRFVYKILERAGYENLQDEEDSGKSVFIDRLAANQ